MGVWLSEMGEIHDHPKMTWTYYVYGSGLIPVPHERVNDIAKLKCEHHAEETRRASMYVMAIRVA
jgi:hypothetical protein